MADLIEEYTVTDIYIKIKFGVTVKVSTIVNGNFLLNKTSATPSTISNPFKTISLGRDYNSISRILYLYFSDGVLQSNSPYTFTTSGLTDVLDNEYINAGFSFATEVIDPGASETSDLVFPEPVIVDYAISDNIFDIPVGNQSSSTVLSLVSQYPEDNSYYLFENENNGRISLTFNMNVSNTYISSPYIKVQKREIKKAPTRWVDVNARISFGSSHSVVNVDLPSIDHYPLAATPSTSSAYNTPSYSYFAENYKYRILISKSLVGLSNAATPSQCTMLSDIELLYCGVLNPMYIDIDEISAIFTEAGNVEIAENIHYFSLEVKNLLGLEEDVTEIPFVAMEYIKAATSCSLEKIYATGSGFSMSFTLGDLTVNKPKSSGTLNRGTATSWCELASILRSELLSSTSRGGFRSVVRGSKYENPIPIRKIRDFDAIDTTVYGTGSIQANLDIQL